MPGAYRDPSGNVTMADYGGALGFSRIFVALASGFAGFTFGYTCGYLDALTIQGLKGPEAEFYAKREGLLVGSIDFAASMTLNSRAVIGPSIYGVALFASGSLGLTIGALGLSVATKIATNQKSASGPTIIASNICTLISAVGGYKVGQTAGKIRGACRVSSGSAGAGAEQAAIRARVLANIEASKASRLSSNFEQHVRRETAYNYYRFEAGWHPSRISSHMKGIDFTKPVSIVDLPVGTRMVQFAVPGTKTGNYFAETGTAAAELGINLAGRIPMLMHAPFGARALQSTACEIDDTWTVPGTVFHASGGGIQYFVPNQNLFTVGF
jgi:hypothetical protein